MTTSVLTPGAWAWIWPRASWPDASKCAADCVSLGIVGVIPQASLGALAWAERHRNEFESAGVSICLGLGLDGEHAESEIIDAIVAGIDAFKRVMLDWEKIKLWETLGGNARATRIVAAVLQRRPEAFGCVADCPWWAALTTPDGHASHPHAPTAIFGELCGFDRYVQAYGAPTDGASAGMLAWARSVTQYPSIGAYQIRPAHQMYHRSVRDVIATTISEPTVALWDLAEMDDACRLGLRAVKALRERGCDGASAVAAFQRIAGLAVDGVPGPNTLRALGVAS